MKKITLSELINKLEMRASFIRQLDGQDVSSRKVVLGPFLHQNTGSMMENESAEFEMNHKEVFDQMRKIQQDTARFLK